MAKKSAAKKVVREALVVTELQLVSIATGKAQLEKLNHDVRELRARIEGEEAQVIEALKKGAAVQGRFTAIVTAVLGACRPKWKEMWIAHMVSDHKLTEAVVVEAAQKLYPATTHDELVIGLAPPSN